MRIESTQTKSLTTNIVDDGGTMIAIFSGMINPSSPNGTIKKMVLDKVLYEVNKDAVDLAYLNFEETFYSLI